ncbi:MAG: hypothetical protein CMH27_02490 [Micavibrio sp.]|nr:hypothetical protein [Micavibrio sp.]
MRRVRALDKISGEFQKILHADEVQPQSRYQYHYSCLNPNCTQSYHWRKSYRMDGNKVQVPATFVENHKSQHNKGCRYDFMKIAARHREVAFARNGHFYLRINFPLGAAVSDIHVPSVHMAADYVAAANEQKHGRGPEQSPPAPGLPSMGAVVRFLEQEFGSIEAPQCDVLKLQYQGLEYDWRNLYAASDRYEGIVNVPQDAVDQLTQSRLAVVKIMAEARTSKAGNRSFLCETQSAAVSGASRKIRPSIVCADEGIATMMREMIERDHNLLVAARPYTPDLSQNGSYVPRKEIPVAFYIADRAQFSIVANRYWRPRPGLQIGLDL